MLIRIQIIGPQDFKVSSLRWGLMICMSNMFLGDAATYESTDHGPSIENIGSPTHGPNLQELA